MKTFTHGNIKTAVDSIRTARWRSFLTMLGIIIGVVSVVSIVSIGEGVKSQVKGQIENLGKDLITIRPGRSDGTLNNANFLTGISSGGSLTHKDLETVESTPGVKLAVPFSIVPGKVVGDHEYTHRGLVIGTTEKLPEVLNKKLSYGEMFDTGDQSNLAVIGNQVAKDLFDENVPLGRSFTLRDKDFIVVGILKPLDTAPLSVDNNFNNTIFVPYDSAAELTNNAAPIYEILSRPDDPDKTNGVVKSINSSLLKSHGGQEDFSVIRQQESLAVTNNILNLLTALIGGVAAISLLVGGIGIMNVMLVSVTERMHEIGVRKAVGATNRQILSQFIIEATVLSLTGGFIGVIVSFIAVAVLHIFTNLRRAITWEVVAAATIVSVLVGVVFGSAPALKAARKDPIDALRND